MKKIIIVSTLILVLTFFACKKKEATPAPVNTSTTTTSGAPAGLSPSTGGEYCSLQTTYSYYNIGGSVAKDSVMFATFYAAPSGSVTPTTVYAGTVSLNGFTLPNTGTSYFVIGSAPVNISNSLTWNVTGSGTVTPFSQSFTPNYPKYTGGNLLPDTCIKANGITINISGVSNNQNTSSVYLNAGSNSIYKYILGSNGTVTFSPSELSGFTTNQTITILVLIGNYYSATLGGIKRGFSNTLQYTKYSYLK